MTWSVLAALAILIAALGVVVGNLLKAQEEGRVMEVLILVGAAMALVVAAAALLAARREVAAARAAVGLVAEELAAVQEEIKGITIRVMEMTPTTAIPTTPARAAAAMGPESPDEPTASGRGTAA